ncbi:MAG: efflux RND transporter periplasmic adaptor subunit [Caedimonadaceae bacterium]|nr:MAG: efflux RND transporter periplasmic adaptor subunit [Caedimonadaceae bacterium]
MKRLFALVSLCALISLNWSFQAHSHGGEVHQQEQMPKAPISLESSYSSSDLSLIQRLFVPKDKQFEKKMTTFVAKQVERPKHEVLPAKVLASPTGYAQVHVAQASRVIADSAYPMPSTGDVVDKDQVIAVIEPLWTSVELVDKKKELYKIEGEIVELEREIKRLTTLGTFAPAFKLDFAKTNIERAKRQKEQILATGLVRNLIRAPISGILSDSHILPGQVIQPDQPLAEIVNPSSLRIEAYTFDYALAEKIMTSSLKSPSDPTQLYPLTLVGLSPKVGDTDQSRHILFSLKENHKDLMIGMVVEVIVATDSNTKKITIPQSALLKSGKNYSVFVLAEPELIMAKPIELGLFFDQSVEVLEGLKAGERVVEDIKSVRAILSVSKGIKDVH